MKEEMLMPQHWLMKSEPETYSIDDLKRDKRTAWEGVRNFQARNFMRDDVKVGDLVLFYHSGGDDPGVAGVAKVCSKPHADLTALDKRSDYFDRKASKDNPIWMMVDIAFVRKLKRLVPLAELRRNPRLRGMPLLRPGQRLSVQPVSPEHFKIVLAMANRAPSPRR
jgi:predicted RNA-binding protein with PUA-like domain